MYVQREIRAQMQMNIVQDPLGFVCWLQLVCCVYTLVGSSMLNSSMRLVRSSRSGSTTSR